jgi:ATP-independent RNA helicase DbpA
MKMARICSSSQHRQEYGSVRGLCERAGHAVNRCGMMRMPQVPETAFDTLSLPPATLENLRRLGYHEMTAIQAASLPPALLGKDLIARPRPAAARPPPSRWPAGQPQRAPLRRADAGAVPHARARRPGHHRDPRLARAEDNIKVVTLSGGVPLRGQTTTLQHGAHIVGRHARAA